MPGLFDCEICALFKKGNIYTEKLRIIEFNIAGYSFEYLKLAISCI